MKTISLKDIKKYNEDIIEGFHSGFPECCIMEYILHLSLGIYPGQNRDNNFYSLSELGWVPCEKHCKKFTEHGLPLWAKKLPIKNGYFFLEYNEKTKKLEKKEIFEV